MERKSRAEIQQVHEGEEEGGTRACELTFVCISIQYSSPTDTGQNWAFSFDEE